MKNFEKIKRHLKTNLKGKIKLTKALIITFLITGSLSLSDGESEGGLTVSSINIEIHNHPEEKGLELGTNGLARGIGSITTGNSNIAIGNNAVSTGGNESKETIEEKLNENRIKLEEIKKQEDNIRNSIIELEKLKKRNKDIIDAANRVAALTKSKQNLLNEYNRLKNERINLEESSAEKLRIFNEKIYDLNSRLNGVINLGNINISSPEGIKEAAVRFKADVERDNNLRLSEEFYEDYIVNYYKVIGDLRRNNKIVITSASSYLNEWESEDYFPRDYPTLILNNYHLGKIKSGFYDNLNPEDETKSVIIKDYIKLMKGLNDPDLIVNSDNIREPNNIDLFINSERAEGTSVYSRTLDLNNYYHMSKSATSFLKNTYYVREGSEQYGNLGTFDLITVTKDNLNRTYSGSISKNARIKGKTINTFINIDTDKTTDTELEDWNNIKDEWKAKRKEYNVRMGDEFSGKLDVATNGKSTILYNLVTDIKFELVDLDKKITNIQWQYERDGSTNTTMLDEKKKLMVKRKKLLDDAPNLINNKMKELEIEGNFENMNRAIYEYALKQLGIPDYALTANSFYKHWKKTNITDIVNKNKITLDKLTSDLEDALGINRAEIETINRNIENAKNLEERAKNNYLNITISEADLILAREYENIIRQINSQEEILSTAKERLRVLKEELTLNDFKTGENAIAFGNNTLSSGKNSIAFGKGSITTGESGLAIGDTNLTTGKSSIAIGHGNNAIGENGVALGQQNSVKGNKVIAIGYRNTVDGSGSSVIGDPNNVYGDNVHILGNNNSVGTQDNHKNNVFILGSNIDASNVENAIVLGNESKAISDVVSVGNDTIKRKIVNVKEAEINDTSYEVVVGKQLFELANGTLEKINIDKWKEKLGLEENSGNGNIANKEEFVKNSTDGSNNIKLKGYEVFNISKPDEKINVNDLKNILENEKSNIENKLKEKNSFLENATTNISLDKKYLDVIIDSKKVASIPIIDLAKSNINENDIDLMSAKPFDYTSNKIYVPKEGKVKISNLDDGEVNENSSDAINGRVLNNKLNEIKNEITNLPFLKLDASNLNDNNRAEIINKLSNNANLTTPNGALITDNFLKNYLSNDNLLNILEKGSVTSSTLNLSNNNHRLIGNGDLEINLLENSIEGNHLKNSTITEDKLDKNVTNKLNSKIGLNDINKELINGKIDKGNITSNTLEITNGNNRIIGNDNLNIELKNNSIDESKLTTSLIEKINNKIGLNDLNNNVLSNKLSKSNVISSTLNIVNGNEKVLGNNDLEINLKDSSIEGKHIIDGSINENKLEKSLKEKINTITTNSLNMKNYIKKDGSNIDETVKEILVTKLSSGSSLDNPTNSLITDNVLKNSLDKKVDKSDFTSDSINKILDKGNIVSKTLSIKNGNNRILGNEDLKIELSDEILNKLKNNGVNLKGVEYDDLEKTKLTLGNKNISVNVKNVSLPIDDFDASNKIYVDNKIKEVNSTVSNSIAISQIPQVSSNKLFSIGAGTSYNEKTASVALGISGQDKNKRFIYKLSAALSSSLKFSAGIGFNYSFGKTNDEYSYLEKENKELKENLSLLKKKYDELDDKIGKLSNIKNSNTSYIKTIIENKDTIKYIVDDFIFNKYTLTDSQKNKIDEILKKVNSENEIEIVGFTDTIGEYKYNLNLGLNRAKEVMEYMILNNKNLNIKISSLGFNQILNSNDNELRRVEIIVK